MLEKNILQFDVSVNNPVGMAVLYSVDKLDQNFTRFELPKLAPPIHIIRQFTAVAYLHDHDQLLTLDKRVIELNNVSMVQLFDTVGLFVDIVYFACVCHYANNSKV